jgi:hypothetical protein
MIKFLKWLLHLLEPKTEATVTLADLNTLLNTLRADETLASAHAFTILARVKAEVNKLGAGA